jgi:hypothetical protein
LFGVAELSREKIMTAERKLLLETLMAHFAWLDRAHPQKASSILAQRASQYVRAALQRPAASTKDRLR